MNDSKSLDELMERGCIELLKNKMTSIINFTEEKSHLPEFPAFFIHLNMVQILVPMTFAYSQRLSL